MSKRSGPLSHLRVLEMAQYVAGPFAGQLFADLGADVLKVEPPNRGDLLREWDPKAISDSGEAFSQSFASLNRNKRSISLDIKQDVAKDALLRLAEKADVFLENFRPGTLSKLGLGYDALRAVNPRLVYCSISGYGQSGPSALDGAFDVTIQAASGLMSVTGEEDGEPVKCGIPVADVVAGLYATYTVLAAVVAAQRTGHGAHVDCPMFGCMLGISALQTSEYFGTGVPPRRIGSRHPKNAPYQAFQAMDKPFVIAAGNDKLWTAVCEVVGLPDLIADPRFITVSLRAKNQRELAGILQPVFALRTASEWLSSLNARGVPCAQICDVGEALDNPQSRHLRLVQPMMLPNGVESKAVRFPVSISGFDFGIFQEPPVLGAHGATVLEEWLTEVPHAG